MTTNFVIFHQAAGTTPGEVTQFQPNTSEYTYIASAARIALSMLKHPASVQCLTRLAMEYDNSRGRIRFGNNPVLGKAFVEIFLAKIEEKFPMIVVNDTMTDRALLGYHPRGDWEGTSYDFNPRQQSVNVNGLRVRDMIAAWESSTRFPVFQFMFAILFVHEVGAHMLVTFLTNGRRPFTPPTMTAGGYGGQQVGESGRYLERILFGGSIAFYRDPNQGVGQSGIPHLEDHVGFGARRISAAYISEFTRYHFSFPMTTAGAVQDRRNFQAIGLMSSQPVTDPNERQMMARQTTLNIRVPSNAGFRVSTRDLYAVPTNPRIRLRAC